MDQKPIYQMKYSVSPIRTEAEWEAGLLLDGGLVSMEDSLEKRYFLTSTGFAKNSTIYFAIRSVNSFGMSSEISNCVSYYMSGVDIIYGSHTFYEDSLVYSFIDIGDTLKMNIMLLNVSNAHAYSVSSTLSSTTCIFVLFRKQILLRQGFEGGGVGSERRLLVYL